MCEEEVGTLENPSAVTYLEWTTAHRRPPLSAQEAIPEPPQPRSAPQNLTLQQPPSSLSRPEMDSSCMEIEAAQRKLQEIEDRCAKSFTRDLFIMNVKYLFFLDITGFILTLRDQ